MKKIKSILSVLMVVTLIVFVVGCSGTNKSSSEIISDLEAAGFKASVDKSFAGLSELTGNNSYNMSCNIMNNAEFETTNIYECNIKCTNSDFEVSYDLKVTYIKNNGWQFSEYEVANITSKINTEIPDERIINDIETHFANTTVEIDKSTISKKNNESGIGCEVSVTGTICL